MAGDAYQRLEIGEQLGHLEYAVTPEQLQLFREAVEFPEACFPSIAAKEYAEVLVRKHGRIPVISAKHQDHYLRPPRLLKRLQVTGWVREKYQRRGRRWLVVETFSVDEDGTEVLRSQHTFMLPDLEVPKSADTKSAMPPEPALPGGERLPPLTKVLSQDKIDRFETLSRGLRPSVEAVNPRAEGLRLPQMGQTPPRNIHTDAALAEAMGLSAPIASGQMAFAYLHELLARRFGDDFLWGGQLAVTFVKPLAAGDAVTAHGVIRERRAEERRTQFIIEVWLESQRGDKTAVGEGR
ncbi:MAG TPA: MaoC/PaaZ C-terminal domain-containing protein, partial [Dehalococcoidia bacterium]|nr:MaoC/PaaZ C-terminal domain-containing protein [Dehalococcoidia bacterium]